MTKIFFRGLFAFVPIAISIYVVIQFFHWTESFVDNSLFHPIAKNYPGLGFILVLVVIYLFGLFVSNPFLLRMFYIFELPFKNIPLVKILYGSIQDLMEYFNNEGKQRDSQVVAVNFSEGIQAVGLVTRENLRKLDVLLDEDKVAVFFPLSYAIGGHTLFIAKKNLQKLNMPSDVAMRMSITAWMGKNPSSDVPAPR